MVLFGLSVAWQGNSAPIGGGQMDVDHLDGFEFLQYGARSQARSQFVESAAQSHMQAVSDKGDENVCFNPLLELMVDRADSQITFEIAECFLDLGQLDIKLPELSRIDADQIGAQQITTFL